MRTTILLLTTCFAVGCASSTTAPTAAPPAVELRHAGLAPVAATFANVTTEADFSRAAATEATATVALSQAARNLRRRQVLEFQAVNGATPLQRQLALDAVKA